MEVGATATNIIVLIASLAGSVISGIAIIFGLVESCFEAQLEGDTQKDAPV